MKKETITALLLTLSLSGVWLFLNRGQNQLIFYLVDVPYFIILTGMTFSIGLPAISQGLRYGTKTSIISTIVFPLILIFLYYLYLWIHGQPVLQGTSLLLPYLILFPVLALFHRTQNYKVVSWWDLVVLILFLLPITLVELPEDSDLPLQGVHFDSLYRIIMILTAIYAFVVVRRLTGVGFWMDAAWRKLWTTVWVWLVYIGLVIALGVSMGFVSFAGLNLDNLPHWEQATARFLTIYLHTALFEELFFRGLLQNILAQKVRQSSSPFLFWIVGGLAMIILSFITGIWMSGGLFWFPLLITCILFAGAYGLSKFFTGFRHHFLALAITSVLFGLVHFHAGSVVYVGLAILAGWAYGYVYWRTRSVFYAALIHTLVNFSPIILGIELIN